ncbi:MAG: indole-3-glycerol-phosphate synthase [Candidatus Bathyarchaeia archaeon]|nr:indole-3-glycerol-phosphate synthase [Candidatus Bathyarchaeota archaeon]
MLNFLEILVKEAEERISSNYYKHVKKLSFNPISLKNAILRNKKISIIAEIKKCSPSIGDLVREINIKKVALEMEKGGAIGISILTEPKRFKGSLKDLIDVRKQVKLPILMKDIIISFAQIEAAANIGANAILLIKSLFDEGFCKINLEEAIDYAHSLNLEVLLETHTEQEFDLAIKTKADLIGINNRNLKNLKVDLNVTRRILSRKIDLNNKVIVSESGIKSVSDIQNLRKLGVHAFLIGSSIITSKNIQEKVMEYTGL